MLLVVTILTRYISLAANQNRHALFKTNLDGIQEKEFKFLFFLNRSYNLSLKQINKKQIELFFYFMVFTTCKGNCKSCEQNVQNFNTEFPAGISN